MYTYAFFIEHNLTGKQLDYVVTASDVGMALTYLREEYPKNEFTVLSVTQN